jgi:hypothetical protein
MSPELLRTSAEPLTPPTLTPPTPLRTFSGDDDLDRVGPLAAEVDEAVQRLAGDDAQRPGGLVVLDAGALGGLDVGGLARVAGADLDNRVGPVGGDEADVGDVEVEGDDDRGRGVEGRDRHPSVPLLSFALAVVDGDGVRVQRTQPL